jgi:hypothetical protein
MLEILAKRLALLVRLIIVVTLVSGVFWAQKAETSDLRNDLISLNSLEALSDLSPSEVLDFSTKHTREVSDEITKVLAKKEYKAIANDLEGVRSEIGKWLDTELRSNNIDPYIFQISIKLLAEKIEVKFSYTPPEVLSLELSPTWFDAQKALGLKEEILIASVGPINDLLPGKPQYLDPDNIFTLIEFIPGQHQSRILGNLEEQKFYGNTVSKLLGRLDFFASPIKISIATLIEDDLPSFPDEISESFILEIPVQTQIIESENLLGLVSENEDEINILQELYSQKSRKKFLDGAYGLLPIKEAKEVLSGNIVQAYQRVELLGFSISTRKLPIAVVSLFIMFLGGSFLTVRYARANSLKIISQVNDENPIDILIDNFLSRIVIFCIFPILSIMLALPTYPVSLSEAIFIGSGVLLILILGILVVIKSRKL